MERSITNYFRSVTPNTKRKQAPSSSSECDTSPSPRQDQKRFHQHDTSLSDSFQEEAIENMSIQATLDEIKKQFENLATKDDIRQLRTDMEKVFESLSKKCDLLESRCFEVEKQVDLVTKENAKLKDELHAQRQLMSKVMSDQNDLEQYDRRLNLRVFNVEEKTGETAEDCTKKVCDIFTKLVGVPTKDEDLDAAHRTGPIVQGKRRSIIVRFRSRKHRDKVIADRRKLKGKGVSVDEDLTVANAKLASEAFKHSASIASWTSHGKVLAKLKNGKTVRLKFGTDVDKFFRMEMDGK